VHEIHPEKCERPAGAWLQHLPDGREKQRQAGSPAVFCERFLATNEMPILEQLRSDCWVQSAKQQEGHSIMGKKIIVTALAVFAFGFGSALRSNAGTDMIEPYNAPAPTYNYAPPPRPVYYAPPPVVGVVVAPAYGYYAPRFGVYRAHRFHGRHAYWRSHHHWR
jgi:hypothetical protein